jgi:hypothetical protein
MHRASRRPTLVTRVPLTGGYDSLQVTCELVRYEGSRRLESFSVNEEFHAPRSFGGAEWETVLRSRSVSSDAVEHSIEARVTSGVGRSCAAGFSIAVPGWRRDHYLLVPGVVYAGNRFEIRRMPYSPRPLADDCRRDCPTLVTDIPRLNFGEGPSRIRLLAGGMSQPAVAAFDPATRRGWIVLAPSHSDAFEVGFEFLESDDRREAELRVTVPGVRERRYRHMNADAESSDRAADVPTGGSLRLAIRVHEFDCPDVQALFDRLFDLRSATSWNARPPTELPLSAAVELVEQHYNRDFWWEQPGLYRQHPVDSYSDNPYQTGWCGGIIAEAGLLANSDDVTTRMRSTRHLDEATSSGMLPNGLFFGKYSRDAWRGDFELDKSRSWLKRLTLVRRQGDALLYLLRAMNYLEVRGQPVPERWIDAARRSANVMCEIWHREGQFGQFIDQFTGEIRVGNSASGAIIPAALVEAFQRLGGDALLQTALACGEHFRDRFTRRGLTTGGPGDALQCPDSESSYALVESYVSLFEATGDPDWRQSAEDAAKQFATWVMPYDYPFPAGSLFHRLGIRSAGAVFANAQNGHAAPGICTHSGLGLFKLFRATGDRRYLDLLRSIARALPQYVARDDRPIIAVDGRNLPSGWINERCNTSDWDDNIGGVFYGPCWPEVSLLLTRAELPGLYVQPDTSLVCMIDNLQVDKASARPGELLVRVANPTAFHADLTVLVETSLDASRFVPGGFLRKFRHHAIPAGSTLELILS